MTIGDIDEMAFAGYEYALNGRDIPKFETEMDLLAFNAGISNANIRHNLNVPQLTSSTSKSHDLRERVSDKELQTTWGNN